MNDEAVKAFMKLFEGTKAKVEVNGNSVNVVWNGTDESRKKEIGDKIDFEIWEYLDHDSVEDSVEFVSIK